MTYYTDTQLDLHGFRNVGVTLAVLLEVGLETERVPLTTATMRFILYSLALLHDVSRSLALLLRVVLVEKAGGFDLRSLPRHCGDRPQSRR